MTKYILLADSFIGNQTYIYDHKGFLVEWQLNCPADVDGELHSGILRGLGMSVTDAQLKDMAARCGYTVKSETIDLSWERFYDMYGVKKDGFKGERLWKKMNEKQRYHAFIRLKAYKRWLKNNPDCTQMYVGTFLGGGMYDDYDRVPNWNKTNKEQHGKDKR